MSDAKKPRLQAGSEAGSVNADMITALNDTFMKLSSFADELDVLDTKISKEQCAILRKYWPEMSSIFGKRDAVIEEEKGLWGRLIASHPSVVSHDLIAPPEVDWFCETLKSVKLEDAIDDNNSYRITFQFDEAAAKIFEPLVWVKTVYLKDDMETVDEDKTQVTDIKFKNAEDDPRKAIEQMKQKRAQDSQAQDSGDEDEDEDEVFSIVGWFSQKSDDAAGAFGEIFRKEVYTTPHTTISHLMMDLAEEMKEQDEEDE